MSNVGWLAPSSSGHSGGDRQSHQEESSCPGSRNGGRFVDIAEAYELRLLQLNVVSTVHLSKRLLPAMVERGVGRMLFTAAVASTMPGPFYATYAATKSFMLSFAEALRYEVKDSSVTVTALMPGPTDNIASRGRWDRRRRSPW